MSGDLKPCPWCSHENIEQGEYGGRDYLWCAFCQASGPMDDPDGTIWNTRSPAPAVAALEAEVARLRADVTYERGLNGRDAERIFTLSLLNDEIEVLTNAASSFDVQDGIALAAFRKRLVGLWRARDRLPAPSEKEAHCDDLIPADRITELEAEVGRLRRVEAGAQGVSRALEIHGYPVSEAAWENTREIMSAEARQLHLAAVFLNRALNPKGGVE